MPNDDDLADALESVSRFLVELAAMSDREQAAFMARAVANGAFHYGLLPEDLLPGLFATIGEVAGEAGLSPEAVAIEAFRRHGYWAEMQEVDAVVILRAVRVQG
ncbi:hypothetical protein [Salinarimonas soli]|uniref:Uncharacterized protein n=1 Tax=Salinarimonas soli TaxID=1638099 RepID=A0A5B2V739_9HYPH|nr:hypothetical protein [Salinarimonas soli]KAA2234794.1 hypothetical protein F0L46_22865 [Salinarimonas soli]